MVIARDERQILPASKQNARDRKSTRLNSSHTEIYTLSLHDALPISPFLRRSALGRRVRQMQDGHSARRAADTSRVQAKCERSEEHTSELQSHRDLHSFPTRRSSDLSFSSTFSFRTPGATNARWS